MTLTVEALRCVCCSAPVQAGANRCEYCGVGLMFKSMVDDPRDYRPAISVCSTAAFNAQPGGITYVGYDRYGFRMLEPEQLGTLYITTGSSR